MAADMLPPALRGEILPGLAAACGPDRKFVALTGAGISAESGIPTFRGEDGFWTVGSVNYRPQDFATREAFLQAPELVLGWYLHRRALYADREANPGHLALAAADATLGDGFVLVTQNVDGLHRRAGHPDARMWCIHGDLSRARCSDDDCPIAWAPVPWPDAISRDPADWPRGCVLSGAMLDACRCPACGCWLRPHVLWFDEFYDEERFRFDSSLDAVETAAALLVVGTSGATNLPTQMVRRALARGIPLVVVDVEETVFSRAAVDAPGGWFVRARASEALPAVAAALCG